MSTRIDWGGLALLTLRAPSEAAHIVTGLNLPRDVLWSALALVAIFNTVLFSVSEMISPVSTPIPDTFANPFVFFVIVAGGLLVSVAAFYWTGRVLGSSASSIDDLLALMVWLQALRAAAQAVVIVLMVVSPVLGSLLVFAASIFAVWILLHFLSVGLKLDSLWRAFGVLVAGSLALILGLSVILSFTGIGAMGLNSNV
ncbi:YIP1 family protein [Sulfitobacter sp. D35]|uniref:YIP1 family protein n=1 Tax=Sulfitobacter sp. D35 TaxID=3083252 RepID=UPI00296F0C7E|nr:YIP1 family protein [Sulfitobacter sp. D35]MDW4497856.1 YIP1 family protein [Sulfitobacter sp. D35]